MACKTLLLFATGLLLVDGLAQNVVAQVSPATQDGISMQFPPGTPVGEVLDVYESLAQKDLVRDPKIEAVVVNLETRRKLSTPEAMQFIEKSLLLAGIAIVPSGEDMLKVISVESGRLPSREGVPMILRESELPQGDQVVNFLLALQYLDAEEASRAFAQIVPPHDYGKLTAVPNARALLITENSATIRAYLDLAKQVDLPPGDTKHTIIHLERADAEEVTQQLATLLRMGGAAAKSATISQPAPSKSSGEGAAHANPTGVIGRGAETTAPIIQPVPRTNSLVIVARPLDTEYIQSLVKYLDGESPTQGFTSRKLNYIDLTTFITIAEKALQRNSKDTGESGIPDSNQTTVSTTSVGNASRTGSRGQNNGLGSSSGFQGGGYAASGFGLEEPDPLDVTKKAFSVLVAKTLVIVDPASSSFYASGPPEKLRLLEQLADKLDVRPRQILLSAIIGEFTLGDDFNFGLDWIRTIEKIGNDNLVGGVLNTQGTAFADITKLNTVPDFLPALDGLTVYGQIGKHLNVFLHTLEQTERFHVLQKPTVTTLNHQSATIYIGQQIAIPGQTLTTTDTVSTNASIVSTTQYIPVRLQLDITPHIFNNDEVMIEFKQQNNDISGFTTISGNEVPNISEQGMRNSLIVPDRTTVMLGGLITERDKRNKSGLPFLVKVPVLKHLFGSTSKGKERRELLIFVQPRILEQGADHIQEQATMSKDVISYPRTKEFAEPDGTKGLLPLPDWNDAPGVHVPRGEAVEATPREPADSDIRRQKQRALDLTRKK